MQLRARIAALILTAFGWSGAPTHGQPAGEGGFRPPIEESPLLFGHPRPRPETGPGVTAESRVVDWRTAYELTEAAYDTFVAQCAIDGYRPVSVVARNAIDGPRFTVVAHADGLADWVQARSLSAGDMALWASARLAEDYEPVCLAASGAAPSDLYTAVMVRSGDPRTFTVHAGLTGTQYGSLVNTSAAQGRKVTWLAGTGSGSAARYAAVVVDNPTSMGWWTWWGQGETQLGAQLDDARTYGVRPASLSGYGAIDLPRFAGIMHYRRTEDWEVVRSLSLADMQQQESDLRSQGYYASAIAGYETTAGVQFAAVFVKHPEARVLTVTGDESPELAPFDQAMIEHMQNCDIPSAALALVKDGRLVHARGYTYAPASWPVTEPDSLFRVASMSKPLCATAMHQLAERGALHLDDLMVAYPGLDGWADSRAQEVTLRYLLQHRGGWNRDTTFDPVFLRDVIIADTLNIDLPIGIWDIITYMKGRGFQFTPGTQQVYSNLGFLIDARVMEAADGRPYEQIIRQDVLGPLDIYRARVSEWTGDRPGEVPYLDGRDSRPPSVMSPEQETLKGYCYGGYNHDNGEAAGAWIFSAPDYARFLSSFEGLDDSPLLPRTRIEEMWAPGLGDPPDGSFYLASGWVAARFDGGQSWAAGHDGSLFGAATFGIKMQNNVTVVVFMNMRDPGELYEPYQIIGPLIDLALTHDVWPDADEFPTYCASDFNYDRVTDTRDVLAFLNAWVGVDDRCDFSGDAVVSTLDLLAYLNLYTGGCN